MLQNKTVRNAAWIIGVRIVQALLNLLITMLTARFLGPSNFGLINYAASIVAFAVPIMQLGITSVLVQELILYPEEEGKTLGTALVTCLGSGILSVLGVVAFSAVANRGEPETILICALYSLMLLTQATEITTYWFQAHLISKYTALVSLFAYATISAYKFFLLVTHQELYWFALSNALDYLIISAAQLVIYRRLGGQKLEFSLESCKRMVSKGKYYILSGLMITVFSQTDRVMLKLMVNDAATGFYSAAVTCAGLSSFVFCAIIDSARPTIFESKKIGTADFEKNMVRLYSVVIYLALLQSVFIALLAKPIVYIMYGPEYEPTILALRIVVWYTTVSYIGSVRNIWLLAENKQHLIWRIDVSGALANVVLNFILIPPLGIVGAAIASLLTQMFANVVMCTILKDVRPNIRLMLRSLHPSVLLDFVKKI